MGCVKKRGEGAVCRRNLASNSSSPVFLFPFSIFYQPLFSLATMHFHAFLLSIFLSLSFLVIHHFLFSPVQVFFLLLVVETSLTYPSIMTQCAFHIKIIFFFGVGWNGLSVYIAKEFLAGVWLYFILSIFFNPRSLLLDYVLL